MHFPVKWADSPGLCLTLPASPVSTCQFCGKDYRTLVAGSVVLSLAPLLGSPVTGTWSCSTGARFWSWAPGTQPVSSPTSSQTSRGFLPTLVASRGVPPLTPVSSQRGSVLLLVPSQTSQGAPPSSSNPCQTHRGTLCL